jgi:tight adherence protein B
MTVIAIGAGAVALGVAVAVFVASDPGRVRLPRERRRPVAEAGEGALAGVAEAATSLIGRLMHRRGASLAVTLDVAGVRMRPQDFGFLVAVGSVVLAALVLLLGGGFLALLAAPIAPLLAAILLRAGLRRRRDAFAAQLDGTLQLMASSLRAGYSLMQALSSVAKQSEEPTSSELGRVVNQSRVGKPVVSALEEAAARMASQDLQWAAQAIAINREVGGSLAETLDGVAGTIRERGQIRRQVRALSAEGRFSAAILMALPFVVAGILLLITPNYLAPFVESALGIILLVLGAIMLTIGGVWMLKVTKIEF